jgi:hypothetical protein
MKKAKIILRKLSTLKIKSWIIGEAVRGKKKVQLI